MNKYFFPSRLFLLLLTLALGQLTSFGQYYPPAVSVPGLSGGLILTGGGGSYSGGYYYDYTYNVDSTEGYWDYTNYGHYETQDQGYWDNSRGHYEDQGNWDNTQGYYDDNGNFVPQPVWISNYVWVTDPAVWIPNPVSVWVNDPTWVVTHTTTNTYTSTAYVSVNLSIDGVGNASLSAYDYHTGSTGYWNGSYGFYTGGFSGSIPSASAVNPDGSGWSAPPPPPNYASYGPPALWVEGVTYAWAYTSFNDPYQNTGGVDYYADGSGHTASFQSGNNTVYGVSPGGSSWSGTATNRIVENTSGVDVRFADNSGNYLRGTAPSGMPPAIRADGSSALWNYIGQGVSLHYYAGDVGGQRLTIDPSSFVVEIQNYSNPGLYSHNVIWTLTDGRDIRAVSLNGAITQSDQSPSWGPPAVLVNQALWRYAGTWDGSVSFPNSYAPMVGDHYLGDNANQCLVVNASGNVSVFGMGDPVSGTYAPQSEQAGAPKVFTVAGYDIFPGDANGAYFKYKPSVGPPAVWVNGVTFAFANSKEQATQLGTWVDTYVDGNNNYITVSANEVLAFQGDGSSNWSGYFVPADSNLGDGGIFVVVNGSPRYDVRASSGVTLLPPQGSPLNGHPSVVEVDGVDWNFGGSTTDTDYYFGASPGQRLWIDATGAVSFTNTVNSPNLAGAGNFSGSIFLVGGHDLRACTSDSLPVAAVGTPQWGPAALWVKGVVWNFIGSVADDTLNVHADYYGGMNAGQVVSVDSSKHVGGAYTGVFDGGVFVVNGGADLRALDATGAQIPPGGTPANGYPASLRIGGLHWNFIGTSNGQDYYAAALGGQRLSIDASGAVVYSDEPHQVNGATGTYADGAFTATSGGLSFNAGTIGNDLDILGNVVSFGSLQGNSQTAGVTLQFMDDGTIATLQSALGRPQARWGWSRAATNGGSTALPVMQLDEQGRLNLYDPATAATPQVAPTVSLAPSVQAGVQTSKLPKLELSNQTLDTDNSVVTKSLGDERYLRASGANQGLALTTGINVNTGGSGSNNTVPTNAAAIGQNLQVSSGQVVVGRNNTAANNEVFVVGAGTSPTQTKNALSVSDSGDTTVAGNLAVTGETTLKDATVSGTLTVAGSPVLTQGSGTGAYLTSGQLEASYLKSAAAATTYLTNTAAASQFLPVTSDTVSVGVGNAVGPAGIGIGGGANAGAYAVAIGSLAGNNGAPPNNYPASGNFSVALGRAARAPGLKAIAQGWYNWAEGESSIALGSGSTTRERGGIALGESTESNQVGQVVLGTFNQLTTRSDTRADGDSIFVIGNGTAEDARSNAFVIKRNGDTLVSGTLTVGGSAVLTQAAAASTYATQTALTSTNTAISTLTTTLTDHYVSMPIGEMALGTGATTSTGGWAFGYNSIAGVNAISLGTWAGSNGTPASGANSVSIGYAARSPGVRSYAIGDYTWAGGDDSIAYGSSAFTRSENATAIGRGSVAAKPGQVAIGAFNTLDDELAPDLYHQASPSDNIFIVGNGTSDTQRSNAFVIKRNGDTQIFGTLKVNNQTVLTQADKASFVSPSASSVSMGSDALADSGAWAIGNGALAGPNAISIGDYSGNNGWYHADGSIFKASGDSSVSVGYGSHGYGPHSVAVGFWNWAQGDDAISLGYESQAGSNCSVAIGKMAQATRWGQVVLGSFNELSTSNSDGGWANNNPLPTDDLFIVGNGTADDARSNALVIKRNGDAKVSGSLTINGDKVVLTQDIADTTYLKSSAAATTYLTSAAAASQFLPITANTVSIGAGSTVGPDGIGIGEGANAGEYAVALGQSAGKNGTTPASGTMSVALGRAARSPGEKSITVGNWTWSDGESTIALGTESVTRQRGGIAIGEGTESNQLGQVVIGAFNLLTTGTSTRADDDSIFVIGNGTADNARSNAFVIKRNGDAHVLHGLTVDGTLTINGQSVMTQADTVGFATQTALTALTTTLTGSYLTAQTAAATYALKTDTSNLLSKTEAATTYALQTVTNGLLSKTEAASTYALQTAISGLLSKTEAATTYALKTDTNGLLSKTEATATYLAKTDAVTTYLKISDAIKQTDIDTDIDQKIQTERTASDAAYYRVNQPLVVPNATTLNGSLIATQSSRFQASFVVEGQTDSTDATHRTVIAKPGQEVLVPEQGDISMGEFRNGNRPVSQ